MKKNISFFSKKKKEEMSNWLFTSETPTNKIDSRYSRIANFKIKINKLKIYDEKHYSRSSEGESSRQHEEGESSSPQHEEKILYGNLLITLNSEVHQEKIQFSLPFILDEKNEFSEDTHTIVFGIFNSEGEGIGQVCRYISSINLKITTSEGKQVNNRFAAILNIITSSLTTI